MDERFRHYYHRELEYIREMGAEFASEFPKIAGRLGLEENPEEVCPDPYVERLLEGFAFLAARVHLKLDAEFPRFTQALLETVYPHFVEPTPSMTMVRFEPESTKGDLNEGYTVDRGTRLLSITGDSRETPCEYRTAHDTTLYPLSVREARYLSRSLSAVELPENPGGKAALQVRLSSISGAPFNEFSIDSLPFYLGGVGRTSMRLYEEIFAHCLGVVVQATSSPVEWRVVLPADSISQVGFSDHEKLLPYGKRSFRGYRLIHEYFAFPNRFMFWKIDDLREGCARCEAEEMDLFVLFDRAVPELEQKVDQSHAVTFCSPAINLFPKKMDPIHVDDEFSEFHVVADKTRPRDYEVHRVTDVTGVANRRNEDREFRPFYQRGHGEERADGYYAVQRRPRRFSSKERRKGSRSSYRGSEVYLTLVGEESSDSLSGVKQLHVNGYCTNRDLPLHMPLGVADTDFTLEDQAPISSISSISGPTQPYPASCEGELAWEAISHLSLNYLSLVDTEGGKGVDALREILNLYCPDDSQARRKELEGIRNLQTAEVVRRVSSGVPPAFGRGIQVKLTLEESAFAGNGPFLLGAVLERFFSEYASINSFTETIINSDSRGEIKKWPPRTGKKRNL